MATVRTADMNIFKSKQFEEYIDKIVKEKVESHIYDLIDHYIDDSIASIFNQDVNEKDIQELSKEEANKLDTLSNEKISELQEVERGWVEKSNAYKYIIDNMKRALTDEQIEKIALPPDYNAAEYEFNKFINNLTWDDLNLLFKNNKYLDVNIDSNYLDKEKLETYGTTPTDIYYDLLKQILNKSIHETLKYNVEFDVSNKLNSLIYNEFFADFESKALNLINEIIQNHHMEIFNELFGKKYYLKKLKKDKIYYKRNNISEI